MLRRVSRLSPALPGFGFATLVLDLRKHAIHVGGGRVAREASCFLAALEAAHDGIDHAVIEQGLQAFGDFHRETLQ